MLWYIIILIVILLLIICMKKYKHYEHYDNYDNYVSVLDDSAGFYSQFFFLLNHYINCKHHNKNFIINDDNWIFKSKLGWNDYFEPVILKFYDSCVDKNYYHSDIIVENPISEYKNNIHNIYIYNEKTQKEINTIKNKFGLIDKKYDSIFIRRGDKLIDESVYINENNYIELLLTKNPLCSKIFLQTDDYNCYLNLLEYIKINQLNIILHTLCNENMVGVMVTNIQKDKLKSTKKNSEYLSTIKDKLNNSKTVEEMNHDEKYKHVIDMIVGVDIVCNSNICVTDYQSNVARFIKLNHNNSENVYDIYNSSIDYNKKICPSYSF